MEVRSLGPAGRAEDLNTAGLWGSRLAQVKALMGPSGGCYSILRNEGWWCIITREDRENHRSTTFAEGPSWTAAVSAAEARLEAERVAAIPSQQELPLSQDEVNHVRVADDSLAGDGGAAGPAGVEEGRHS